MERLRSRSSQRGLLADKKTQSRLRRKEEDCDSPESQVRRDEQDEEYPDGQVRRKNEEDEEYPDGQVRRKNEGDEKSEGLLSCACDRPHTGKRRMPTIEDSISA